MKVKAIFKNSFIICALISVIPCLQEAYAANSVADLNLAQMLIEQGEPKEALDFLVDGLAPASANTREWFLMAMAAKQSNRPRQARGYLEKVIELDPENSGRAKLELAQLSYHLGDGDKAKAYLQEVKLAKPPAKVGENIDLFLEQIDANGTPKQWKLTASAGVMHDTNANAGPSVDTVLMYGLPFTLSNGAQKNHDTALMLSVGFDHNAGLTDDIGWQTNASFNRTDYNAIDSLDADVLSGSSGPSWRVMDNLIVSIPVVGSHVKIGHVNSFYSYSYGLAPQLRYGLTEKLSLNTGLSLSKTKYSSSQGSNRNSDNYSFTQGVAYQITPASFARIGFNLGKQHSGLTYFNYNLWGANTMAGYSFQNGLQFSAHASYSDSDYIGKEAAYTRARRDKTSRFGADLSYRIKQIGIDLMVSSTWTKNDSNLIMYEYDRNQTSATLRGVF